MSIAREQMTGGEKGFAEVAGHDIVCAADGGQIDAGIPAKQHIDVCRYMFELCGRQNGLLAAWRVKRISEKGVEQFGEARDGHRSMTSGSMTSDCRVRSNSWNRARNTKAAGVLRPLRFQKGTRRENGESLASDYASKS